MQILAGESLLRLVADLKHSFLLFDGATLTESVRADAALYAAETTKRHEAIQQLQVQVESALQELESHYYSCALR